MSLKLFMLKLEGFPRFVNRALQRIKTIANLHTLARGASTCCPVNGDFPTLGVPFLGVPHNKDCSILVSILGSPYLGKLPSSYLASMKFSDRRGTQENHREMFA